MEVVWLLIYKLATLIVGTLSIYWGYRLFLAGYTSTAGELEAQSGDYHLTLKDVAPGIFFSLFGAIIIVTTIVQGFHVESREPLASAEPKESTERTTVDPRDRNREIRIRGIE